MAFIQKLFSSYKQRTDGDTRIGEINRIWYDSNTNTLRIQLDDAAGGTVIGGGGAGGDYTLPTASTTVKGGVKIDGTTITINNQVISGFSGNYTDLSNKPTIPAAQIQSDWNQTTDTALDYIKNKPTVLTTEADTLDTVTDRGNTTTNDITVGDITTDKVIVNTSAGATVTTGQIAWNTADLTFDMGMANGVTLQVGQEQYIKVKAYEAISDGQAVMFAGADGEHILARKYDPTVNGFIPEWFIGVATQDLAHNAFGYITVFGKVNALNTLAYTVGDLLYADNATPGALTNVAPSDPNPQIVVAAVT
jgi:hypothetical protein